MKVNGIKDINTESTCDSSFLAGLENLEHISEDAKIGKRCELKIDTNMNKECARTLQFKIPKDVATLLDSEKKNITNQEF